MDERRFDEAVQLAETRRAKLEGEGFAPESLPFQIMTAAWNPRVWDEVNRTAQQLLRKHAPLPDMLAEWVADVLAGKEERKRPKRQGRRPKDPVRDGAIVDVIRMLEDKGFTPTRNISPVGEEACAEGGTACDVAGKAFGIANYKDVENIWQGFKRREKKDPFLTF